MKRQKPFMRKFRKHMRPYQLPKVYTWDGNPENVVYNEEFFYNFATKKAEEDCKNLEKILLESSSK